MSGFTVRRSPRGWLWPRGCRGLPEADVDRLSDLLRRAGLPVTPPAIGGDRLLDAMGLDKKVLKNRLRFVLLEQLGRAFVSSDYDADRLERLLAAADA